METIQCTFRLPLEAVELIDKQSGRTRTDKLMSLLGLSCNQDDYSVIKERLEAVENRLDLIEASKPEPKKKEVKKPVIINDKIGAKNRLFLALNDMRDNGTIPLRGNKPNVSKISEVTGVDRGTISKYIDEWLETN